AHCGVTNGSKRCVCRRTSAATTRLTNPGNGHGGRGSRARRTRTCAKPHGDLPTLLTQMGQTSHTLGPARFTRRPRAKRNCSLRQATYPLKWHASEGEAGEEAAARAVDSPPRADD